MNFQYRTTLVFLFTCTIITAPAFGGIAVMAWNLKTLTLDLSSESVSDSTTITIVSNPLIQNTSSEVGLSGTTAAYDHSWLTDMSVGSFNTSLSQTFRSPDVHQVSNALIFFNSSEDFSVHAESVLSYQHTPGNENLLTWQVSMLNVTTGQVVFNHYFVGGNGWSQPSSNSFSNDETFQLPGGFLYRFAYNLDADNFSAHSPNNVMDISGYINWTITPEPGSLMMLALSIPLIFGRQRRS